MDQIFFTNCEYHDNRILFLKNQCKISTFTFVHSDWWWVHAEKMMKKLLFHPDHQEGKNTSLHRNPKFKNART